MMRRAWIIYLVLTSLTAGLPFLLIWVIRPTERDIYREPGLRIGYVETASGGHVDVHVLIGDAFAPRKSSGAGLAFDLVAVSAYFDPIVVNDSDAILLNPLLAGALVATSSDPVVTSNILANIFESFRLSAEVVSRFASDQDLRGQEGDQLVPHIWAIPLTSKTGREQGIKYIATVPLFDPSGVLSRNINPTVTRRRLAENLHTSVRRLVLKIGEQGESTVRSIAFPLIGSTSHAGGDSTAFLEFRQGALTILQSVQGTHTPSALDRVYFVAYERHTGTFRRECIGALQSLSDYLVIQNLFGHGPERVWSLILAGLSTLLFLCLTVLAYQQVGRIWRQANRFTFVTTLLAIGPVCAAVSVGGGSIAGLVAPDKPQLPAAVYAIITCTVSCGLLVMGKRVARPPKRNDTTGNS